MHDDENDVQAVPPLEAQVTVERRDAPLVVRDESFPPVVADPETLIRGLRLLRERIADAYAPLTAEEERALIRASTLDPDLVEAGLDAAEVWDKTKVFTRMTAEEMRALHALILHWDRVEQEFRVLLDGIAGANRKRKHRLGKAILALYRNLGIATEDPAYPDSRLRPYYERMKRAYMKRRKSRRNAQEAADKD